MSDRERLRALVDAYATACDNRDGETFGSLFTPDATLTIYQPFESDPLVTLDVDSPAVAVTLTVT